MSQNQPQPSEEELPIKKYLDSSRHLLTKVKSFQFKSFFQGLITFFSIITAYFIIELTHQHRNYFEKLTKIKLNQEKTLFQVFLFFSIYLIFWNLIARFLRNRVLNPTKKVDEYEELPKEQPQVIVTLPPLPNGEQYAHQIIQNSLNRTIYIFITLVSILAYAFFDQPKIPKMPRLVSFERVNYICIWFLLGSFLNLIGDFSFKFTKIRQFRVLGTSVNLLVGVIVLGLANGLNTFIFI